LGRQVQHGNAGFRHRAGEAGDDQVRSCSVISSVGEAASVPAISRMKAAGP